jgi:hypothetical protein
MGEALFQFKCSTCERFSKPTPQGEEGEEGMVDSLVPGCWVVTGFNCPDCKPTVEEGDRA